MILVISQSVLYQFYALPVIKYSTKLLITMSRGRKRYTEEAESDDYYDSIVTEVRGRRTKHNTKSLYSSKVGILQEWLGRNHPDCVDDSGCIIIPVVNEGAVLHFFAALCDPAKKLMSGGTITVENVNNPMSTSSLKGYRSALVDLYKKTNIKVADGFNSKLKDLLDGYEKLMNDLISMKYTQETEQIKLEFRYASSKEKEVLL